MGPKEKNNNSPGVSVEGMGEEEIGKDGYQQE
jgi:hypothetical protein